LAPTNTFEPLVETSTGWSNVSRLRTVHGARTTAKAATISAAARSRAPHAACVRKASGRTRTATRPSASPRVSVARPISAPTASAPLALGARR
jgi:hypothetical protein